MSDRSRVLRASFVKEIKTWLRNKERLGFVILFPLLYYSAFVLLMGGVYAGPGVDTALVVEEQNPEFYTNGLIEILGTHDPIPPSLRLVELDSDTANRLFETGEILLVITIPEGFEEALQNNQSTSIHIMVNNAHEDMTKNLRMPVIRKLDIFYQTYLTEDAKVDFNVELLNEYTPPRLAYMAWTVMVYGISFGGMFLAASATAQEYEQSTIEELTLSNRSPYAIYAGKMLSGAVLSYISIPAVLFLGWGLYGVLPRGDILTFLAMTLPLAIFTAGVGTILGSMARNSVYVVPLCALVALFYWITGGGIAPLSLTGMGFTVLNEYVPFSNAYRTMIEMFVQGTYSHATIDISVVWLLAVALIAASPFVANRISEVNLGARIERMRSRRKKMVIHA